MSRMVIIGRGGVLDVERIVAIIPVNSSPIKRMLAQAAPTQVLNMTYGFPRKSVVLFDNGVLAVTACTVTELLAVMDVSERVANVDDPASW